MEHLIWKYSSLLAVLTIDLVSARFCEGGSHKCLPPKECCAQGCCYLFSPPSAPRTLLPADHVLNLFLNNLWYFWLVLFAIIIASILLCSLWKKRRVLFCPRWNSPSNSRRAPSELDSTGSCYAPPHYSRCSSFYHAPPPYTEVTSKPDLYPLVFSYASDGSKNGNNGANYLMVQYFRNYIVRPIGSLSATSTVDSLSSSFICTANEANTMIPPPYSSAASPDALSISLQNYSLPRSASQQGCSVEPAENSTPEARYMPENVAFMNRPMSVPNTKNNAKSSTNHQFRASESANFVDLFRREDETYILVHQTPRSTNSIASTQTASSRSKHQNTISDDDEEDFQLASSTHDFSLGNGGASGINFDGNQASSIYHSNDTMLSLSAAMMEKITYSQQTNDHTKLNMIQKQLEKCCEMIQQQQQQIQQTTHFGGFESEPSISGELAKKMAGSPIIGMNYMHSNTGSTVSSLANLNSPGSPPRATSPTQEVKDLLEQINQLKVVNFSDEELNKEVSNEPKPGPSTSRGPNPPFKRPTTLNSKRRFFNMNNRSVYLPISDTSTVSPSGFGAKLRSPSTGLPNVFMVKSRCVRNRNGWVSKSAPTTPGTGLPQSFISDHSPLLNEHDEDAENDQNC